MSCSLGDGFLKTLKQWTAEDGLRNAAIRFVLVELRWTHLLDVSSVGATAELIADLFADEAIVGRG